MNNYEIRSALPSDIPFIYSCWLNSLRTDTDLGHITRKSVFFENYRSIIDRILARSNVLVACKPSEPNVIYSYLVYEPNTLHFAFTKESFRNLNIVKSLFQTAFPQAGNSVQITHLTHSVEDLVRDNPLLIYNPFLLFSKGPEQESGQKES